MSEPSVEVLAERLGGLEELMEAREQSLQLILNDLRDEVAGYKCELRETRKWLLGNGSTGLLEEVRALSCNMRSLSEQIKVEHEHRSRTKVALITSGLALVGVLCMAGVQLALGLLGR